MGAGLTRVFLVLFEIDGVQVKIMGCRKLLPNFLLMSFVISIFQKQ